MFFLKKRRWQCERPATGSTIGDFHYCGTRVGLPLGIPEGLKKRIVDVAEREHRSG